MTTHLPPVVETETPANVPVGSNLWFVYDMERELTQRRPLSQLYEDYYEGRHRLGFMTSKFRETFGQMLAAVNDNWMPLIVRARVERLGVQGIELADDQPGTRAAWEVWQRSELDEDSPLLFTEATKHGEAYTLTWWDHRPSRGVFGRMFSRRSRDAQAIVTVEHPMQFLVRRAAGARREIAAALKLWQEDDGTLFATLIRPDTISRWRREPGHGEKWIPRELDGVPAEEKNPLGFVPAAPCVHDPHMLPCLPPKSLLCAPHYVPQVAIGLGRSVLADNVSTQDQINLLLCHFIVNSEYRSFMQRWATGLEVPEDEQTGEPIEPFESAVDRLWIGEDDKVRFGSFQQDDPEPILKGIDQRIMSLSSRTRTPAHYLPRPTGNYPSGESLKAAETGLVATVDDMQVSFGGAVRATSSFAFMIEGDRERAAATKQVNWRTAESRSESEFVDSLVKKLSIGVPHEQLWIDYGYSPQQIEGFKAMLREAARTTSLINFPGLGDSGMPPEESPEPPDAG